MIAAVIANVSCSLYNYENEYGEYEMLFKREIFSNSTIIMPL